MEHGQTMRTIFFLAFRLLSKTKRLSRTSHSRFSVLPPYCRGCKPYILQVPNTQPLYIEDVLVHQNFLCLKVHMPLPTSFRSRAPARDGRVAQRTVVSPSISFCQIKSTPSKPFQTSTSTSTALRRHIAVRRFSVRTFSKLRGVRATHRMALGRPRRDLSTDESLGACILILSRKSAWKFVKNLEYLPGGAYVHIVCGEWRYA